MDLTLKNVPKALLLQFPSQVSSLKGVPGAVSCLEGLWGSGSARTWCGGAQVMVELENQEGQE